MDIKSTVHVLFGSLWMSTECMAMNEYIVDLSLVLV